MTSLLKLFSLETLINFLVAALSDLVRDPHSARARRVRLIVKALGAACDVFLARVPE